jgi:CheY-like chemotaxis protein
MARTVILAVDDTEDIRTSIADVLTDAGYAVASAANGADALGGIAGTAPHRGFRSWS